MYLALQTLQHILTPMYNIEQAAGTGKYISVFCYLVKCLSLFIH